MNEYFRKNHFSIKMILMPLLIMQGAIIIFNTWDISLQTFMAFSLTLLIASLPTYIDFSLPMLMVGLYFFWMIICSGRMWASLLFSIFPFIFLYIANVYKIKMLGIELMPHDFVYFFLI